MVLFLKVFLTEFIAEMGDKTQLMLIALTSKYKLKDIILGTAAAILVLNGMAVLAGGLVSEFIPAWLIKTIAALAFLYFAASTLAGDDDEEEEGNGKSKIQFAPLAVFCTFFVAELGDKTQLTAITFGASSDTAFFENHRSTICFRGHRIATCLYRTPMGGCIEKTVALYIPHNLKIIKYAQRSLLPSPGANGRFFFCLQRKEASVKWQFFG